jgi:mediator of RNA polymerase II transcription subunit 18
MLVPEARPELSNQALQRLRSIVDDLGTSFAFRQYDRRLFDVRIQASLGNGMPKPLPSVVRVGGRG